MCCIRDLVISRGFLHFDFFYDIVCYNGLNLGVGILRGERINIYVLCHWHDRYGFSWQYWNVEKIASQKSWKNVSFLLICAGNRVVGRKERNGDNGYLLCGY